MMRVILDSVTHFGYSGRQPDPSWRLLMRLTLLCLAALLVVPHIVAAPAPPSGQEAKKKLETLKKRLPDVLAEWVKEKDNAHWLDDWPLGPHELTYKPELRILRRISPNRIYGTRQIKVSRRPTEFFRRRRFGGRFLWLDHDYYFVLRSGFSQGDSQQ
jgi:hypothetical protein